MIVHVKSPSGHSSTNQLLKSTMTVDVTDSNGGTGKMELQLKDIIDWDSPNPVAFSVLNNMDLSLKPHKCNYCVKCFNKERNRNRHVRLHHIDKWEEHEKNIDHPKRRPKMSPEEKLQFKKKIYAQPIFGAEEE